MSQRYPAWMELMQNIHRGIIWNEWLEVQLASQMFSQADVYEPIQRQGALYGPQEWVWDCPCMCLELEAA